MRVQLTPEAVKACFENGHQQDVLEALYRLVFPDWEDIEHLDGYPSVNDQTWEAIAQQFIAFDQKHHPTVVPGGLWLNMGFSGGAKVKDWEVSLKNVVAWPAISFTLAGGQS